jgi:hypothetical protein
VWTLKIWCFSVNTRKAFYDKLRSVVVCVFRAFPKVSRSGAGGIYTIHLYRSETHLEAWQSLLSLILSVATLKRSSTVVLSYIDSAICTTEENGIMQGQGWTPYTLRCREPPDVRREYAPNRTSQNRICSAEESPGNHRQKERILLRLNLLKLIVAHEGGSSGYPKRFG